MKRGVAAFASGLVFAAGLALAGMTRPAKILAFLDVTGAWDPSLALVMLGAIVGSAIAFRVAARRAAPVLGASFQLPAPRAPLTGRLIAGAVLFGIGWGLSGLCPGPAVVSIASGQVGLLVFVAAMIAGMLVEGAVDRARES